jgi:hypothetical protein
MATVRAAVLGPDKFIKRKVLAAARITHHASRNRTHYAITKKIVPSPAKRGNTGSVEFPGVIRRYKLPSQPVRCPKNAHMGLFHFLMYTETVLYPAINAVDEMFSWQTLLMQYGRFTMRSGMI